MDRNVLEEGGRASFFRRPGVFRAAVAIGVAVLVLGSVEAAIRSREAELAPLKDIDSFVWSERLDLLHRGSTGLRTIVLGDSQAMSGILPGELGPDSLNLGMPSMQPEGLLDMVTRLPKGVERVVINLNPYSLFQGPVVDVFRTYARSELLTLQSRSLRTFPRFFMRSAGDGLDVLLHGTAIYRAHRYGYALASFEKRLPSVALPIIRRTPQLADRAVVNAFLADRFNPFELARLQRERNLKVRRILEEHRGFWTWNDLEAPGPGRCATAGARFAGQPVGGWQDFADRPQAAEAWRMVVAELLRQNRKVHVVQIPFSIVWHRATDSRSAYRRLDAFLARLVSELPAERRMRLHLHPRPDRWDLGDAHWFSDWTHLSYCGARRFTRELAAELQTGSRTAR